MYGLYSCLVNFLKGNNFTYVLKVVLANLRKFVVEKKFWWSNTDVSRISVITHKGSLEMVGLGKVPFHGLAGRGIFGRSS